MGRSGKYCCTLKDPGKFVPGSLKAERQKTASGNDFEIMAGRMKADGRQENQAILYPRKSWLAAEAKKHCNNHRGILFSINKNGQGDQPDPAGPWGLKWISNWIKANLLK